jgi:hypothetical protein
MKKLLGITLSLASIVFVGAPATAEAATPSAPAASVAASSAAAPQWRRNRRRNIRNRRVRVVNRTRLVRVGRRVYRETYQVRYLPNGRTQTRLISRVRVR